MGADYTYGAAFVKSLEVNMITYAEFLSALEYDIPGLENLLKKKGYDGEDITNMLENERKKLFEICVGLAENEEAKDVLFAEADFHNIKAIIKAVVSDKNFEELIYRPTTLDVTALFEAIKSGDFSGVGKKLEDVCRTAFSVYKQKGAQEMELYLDKTQMAEAISKSTGFVKGWLEREALFKDLKIYLRSVGVSGDFLENALSDNSLIDISALISSDKSKEETLSVLGYKKEYDIYLKSPSAFEKYCDDEVMEYLQNAKMSFFDFDAILGYFEGKKTEMKNIRLLAYSKKSGMPKEEVKERLRKTYV